MDRQTRAAIATIGTNGIDIILRRLKSRDSRLRLLVRRWEVRFGLSDPDRIITAEQRRGQAIEALYRLGTVAKPAVPTLLALMRDSDPMVRSAATFALDEVAPGDRLRLQRE
jgi:HEAT repeat protein